MVLRPSGPWQWIVRHQHQRSVSRLEQQVPAVQESAGSEADTFKGSALELDEAADTRSRLKRVTLIRLGRDGRTNCLCERFCHSSHDFS